MQLCLSPQMWLRDTPLVGKGQFKRYLDIAQGSLAEVEYYLILAQDLTYITPSQYEQAESLRAETGFLLNRLIESLNRK